MCSFSNKFILARRDAALWAMTFCALFCGLMVWLTPWQMDDLAYGIPYRKEMMSHTLTWRQGWDFFTMHWHSINGRLGDKTLLFWLAMFPKWLFALVAAGSCFSIYYFAGKIVFGSVREHVSGNILLSVALTFFLPWGTYMYITNMFLNYVMGLAVAMPALYFFVRGGVKNASAGACLLAGSLGFLSGSWHEVYSVAALPGMAAFLLLLRGRPGRMRWSVVLGTAAGLGFILCTPGFWMRVNGVVESPLVLLAELLHPSQFHPDVLRNSATGLGVNALVMPCIAVALCVRQWRHKIDRLTWCVALMTAVMLLFTIALYYHSVREARVFFYFDGMAIIAGAMLLRPLFGSAGRVTQFCTVVSALALMLAHCVLVVALQTRLIREHDEIIAAYMASPDGTVYHDCHGNGLGPVFALRKARSCNFYSNQVKLLEDFYRGDSVQIQLMPVALRNFDPVAAARAGKLRKSGLTMVYEGYFVTRDTAVLSKREMWPSFRMAEGDTLMAAMLVSRFRDVYGREWAYLSPDRRHLFDRRPVAIVSM